MDILAFYDKKKISVTWYLDYCLPFVIFLISLFRLEVRHKNPTAEIVMVYTLVISINDSLILFLIMNKNI